MKAIQVKQPGGPEAMELVELPVPEPKANEAVVKLAASGVNFIDVYHREGRYKVPLPFSRAGRRRSGDRHGRGREDGEERRPRGMGRTARRVCGVCGRCRRTGWCRFRRA